MIRTVVVEDFPLMRTAIVSSLDCEPDIEVVDSCGDGDTAVKMVSDLKPDVLVLDLGIPGRAGIGVIESLKASSGGETKILVLSASQRGELVDAAMSLGASGYVTKREAPTRFVDAVRIVAGGGNIVVGIDEAGGSDRRNGRRVSLAPQELQVLGLVARGWTDQQIARELYVTRRTVQNYLARIRDKTGLVRRAELTRWALENKRI